MTTDYANVFQGDDAVSKYQDVQYAPHTQPWAVNERQRRFLRRLVLRRFALPPVQHDFACGTGRAVDLLAGLVRQAHGYDVSTAMMDRAQELGRAADWHLIDADGPVPPPVAGDGSAIITVFRLLLNVSDDVRERAIAFAALALPRADSGVLVVQNHGSRRSLRHLAARRHIGDDWFHELSDAQITALLARHGFRVSTRRGCAIFPQGWYRPRWTRWLIWHLDSVLCATRIFDRYAVDVLYVARRVTES